MNLILAIIWTFALFIDIIACVSGAIPNWLLVFGPLTILVIEEWDKYFKEREK